MPLDQELYPIKGNQEDSSRNGRWTKDEHDLFLKGLQMYGKDWKMITNIVKTRSLVQIRTHAQKYFMRQEKLNPKRPTLTLFSSQEMASETEILSRKRAVNQVEVVNIFLNLE